MVLTHIFHLGHHVFGPDFKVSLSQAAFDGFGPWLVFSWGALCDAFTTEVISSKQIVLQ